jgi:hypothetical protein
MLEQQPRAESKTPHIYLFAEVESNPRMLLPELEVESDGFGPETDIGDDRGKLLVVTLALDQVPAREGLLVSIWGSSDGQDWGVKPLLKLTEKYYCGIYSTLLNLAKHPAVRFLRVEWKTRRWGKASTIPGFGFSVCAESSGSRLRTVGAG